MSNGIVSLNMTGFFKREMKMYALGDIKFRKPLPMKQVMITMGLIIVWTLPIILIFGLHINVAYAALLLVPPVAVGHFALKPIFGGKQLAEYLMTAFSFLQEPKHWTDMKEWEDPNSVYEINSVYWIGRRREHHLLADELESRSK